MEIMHYKGYEGTAELDMDLGMCRGEILFINDAITYMGATPADLRRNFEQVVDEYIETCAELGREPQKPLKGVFNVRVRPEIHKALTLRAKQENTSLNDIISQACTAFLRQQNATGDTFVNLNYFAQGAQPQRFTASGSKGPSWETENVH